MGQIIKVQRPVSSAPINGLYVILEAAFTIAFAEGIIVQLTINTLLTYGQYDCVLGLKTHLTYHWAFVSRTTAELFKVYFDFQNFHLTTQLR
jgi:hypothetical protein